MFFTGAAIFSFSARLFFFRSARIATRPANQIQRSKQRKEPRSGTDNGRLVFFEKQSDRRSSSYEFPIIRKIHRHRVISIAQPFRSVPPCPYSVSVSVSRKSHPLISTRASILSVQSPDLHSRACIRCNLLIATVLLYRLSSLLPLITYRRFSCCTRDTQATSKQNERSKKREGKQREKESERERKREKEKRTRGAFSLVTFASARYSPPFLTVLFIDLCFLANLPPRELQDVLT